MASNYIAMSKLSDTYRQRKPASQEPDIWSQKSGRSSKPSTRSTGVFQDEEDEIERELLVFDLTNKFGPCKGVTRLERWERAEKLGLSPPQRVKDIILSAQPQERENLNQSTWENRGI